MDVKGITNNTIYVINSCYLDSLRIIRLEFYSLSSLRRLVISLSLNSLQNFHNIV